MITAKDDPTIGPLIEEHEPVEMKLGAYIPQMIDARFEYAGLTWHRVRGGFGGRGDREDWVADVPAVSVSVKTGYRQFAGLGWGWDGDHSLTDEIAARISSSRRHLANKAAEARAEVERCETATARLQQAGVALVGEADLLAAGWEKDERPTGFVFWSLPGQTLRMVEQRALKVLADVACGADICHGPGHQSKTACELTGEHDEHVAHIGDDRRVTWKTGEYTTKLREGGHEFDPRRYPETMGMTGYFDE